LQAQLQVVIGAANDEGFIKTYDSIAIATHLKIVTADHVGEVIHVPSLTQ
jgi:hypothetical protein